MQRPTQDTPLLTDRTTGGAMKRSVYISVAWKPVRECPRPRHSLERRHRCWNSVRHLVCRGTNSNLGVKRSLVPSSIKQHFNCSYIPVRMRPSSPAALHCLPHDTEASCFLSDCSQRDHVSQDQGPHLPHSPLLRDKDAPWNAAGPQEVVLFYLT